MNDRGYGSGDSNHAIRNLCKSHTVTTPFKNDDDNYLKKYLRCFSNDAIVLSVIVSIYTFNCKVLYDFWYSLVPLSVVLNLKL